MAEQRKSGKRNLNVQTPGEAPEPEQQPPQEELLENTQGDIPPEDGDEQITLTKAELRDMVSGMVESEAARAVKAYRREQMQPKVKDVNLPDQSEVKVENIRRAVLSKQGYVVPLVAESDRRRMEAEVKRGSKV